ncbi:hypothetical protein GGX14DRAFT_600757 [Mycena pura]|uniref:Zn(2)-C6 fungal-type domain-containing protein n=1 Tax=Mycena pura TaxID=153505 RepID=A0AAD6UVK9_9AGAR|nr:hypothetical protein GGX14DRAFT_600757 [Mycena pura]
MFQLSQFNCRVRDFASEHLKTIDNGTLLPLTAFVEGTMMSGGQAHLVLSPLFTKKRRVIIACTNCRKRKIRCLTAEDSPVLPCERCSEKGLKCEYLNVNDERDYPSTSRPSEKRGQTVPSGSNFSTPLRHTPADDTQYVQRPDNALLLRNLGWNPSQNSPYRKPAALPPSSSPNYPVLPRRNTAPPITPHDGHNYALPTASVQGPRHEYSYTEHVQWAGAPPGFTGIGLSIEPGQSHKGSELYSA